MTGAPRAVYDSGEFIAVRREAVALLGSWEAAGVWHRICWRSERDGSWVATVAQIAEDTMLSEHKAKAALKVIRDAGWLTAERASHRDRTLRWTPLWAGEPRGEIPLLEEDLEGESTSRVEVKSPSTPSSKTVKTTTGQVGLFAVGSEEPQQEADHFEEWWSLYPRKTAKGAARRAYAKAAKSVGHARLLEALRAQLHALREAHARNYCKHPSTWLNGECWDDEVPATAPGDPYAVGGTPALPPRPVSDLYGYGA